MCNIFATHGREEASEQGGRIGRFLLRMEEGGYPKSPSKLYNAPHPTAMKRDFDE